MPSVIFGRGRCVILKRYWYMQFNNEKGIMFHTEIPKGSPLGEDLKAEHP